MGKPRVCKIVQPRYALAFWGKEVGKTQSTTVANQVGVWIWLELWEKWNEETVHEKEQGLWLWENSCRNE